MKPYSERKNRLYSILMAIGFLFLNYLNDFLWQEGINISVSRFVMYLLGSLIVGVFCYSLVRLYYGWVNR